MQAYQRSQSPSSSELTMSHIELQALLNETKARITALLQAGQSREAAFAMDALVQIQFDLIKALKNQLNARKAA